MRLFVAVDVPGLESGLREAQSWLTGEHSKATPSRSFHITLKFLGETGDPARVSEALETVRFKGFCVRLGGLGFFPGRKSPGVVWAGARPEKEFTALAAAVEDALRQICSRNDQPFRPHITLARVKQITDREGFAAAASKARQALLHTDADGAKAEADSFRLIRSTPGPAGPRYETIREYPAVS